MLRDLMQGTIPTLAGIVYDAAKLAITEIDSITSIKTLDGSPIDLDSPFPLIPLTLYYNQGHFYLWLDYMYIGTRRARLELSYASVDLQAPRVCILRLELSKDENEFFLEFKNGHITQILYSSDKVPSIFPDKDAKEPVLLTPSVLAKILLGD